MIGPAAIEIYPSVTGAVLFRAFELYSIIAISWAPSGSRLFVPHMTDEFV